MLGIPTYLWPFHTEMVSENLTKLVKFQVGSIEHTVEQLKSAHAKIIELV